MRFPLAVISGVMGLVVVVNCTPQKPLSPGYPATRPADRQGRPQAASTLLGQGRSSCHPGAGGGPFSIDGALVQPNVAENTRVSSCDRARTLCCRGGNSSGWSSRRQTRAGRKPPLGPLGGLL
jgi:hypothetical protein